MSQQSEDTSSTDPSILRAQTVDTVEPSPLEVEALEGPEGAVPRIHKPKRALPTDVVRPTRAEVHLGNLRHNLHVLRKYGGGTPIWAVLKADGYGHGAKACARTLERAGVDGICVALIEEGVELREAGITAPILVMGGYYGSAFRELVHHELTVVVHDLGQVEALARAVRYSELSQVYVHVKVDTGMGRLGTRRSEWPLLVQALKDHPEVHLDGLMTHLGSADAADPQLLTSPLDLFEEATTILTRAGFSPRLRHAGNSAALLRGQALYDLTRPGIALFGVDPLAPEIPRAKVSGEAPRLRPVMSVVTKIVALRDLAAGDSVGYGGTFVAKRSTKVATIPMGYADGLTRALSNVGWLLVRGKKAPIVGTVSMDMTMIDVSEIADVTIGDDVVLLGSSSPGSARHHFDSPLSISAAEIATQTGTIPWEILTNISRRVPRFYRDD